MRWLLTITLLLSAQPALGAYSFSVPKMQVAIEVRPDASVDIDYRIRFENHGQAIDVVDIGLPHKGYSLGNMSAKIESSAGTFTLTGIKPSTYIDTGVEVPLGAAAIPDGATGELLFRVRMPDLVFEDTTDDAFASMQFTPTWFDADLTVGNTELELMVTLPQGIEPGEVLHQGLSFQGKATRDGRAIVYWRWPSTRITGPHKVGLSFPRRVMQRLVEQSIWDLLMLWWVGNGNMRGLVGSAMLLIFSIVYFRFTAMTGYSVWVLLMIGLAFSWYKWPAWHLACAAGWIPLAILMEWRLRRGRKKYLPPIFHMEGGGIKRGLTAPEAAVILERPLGQVLTLTLFGLLKKELAVLKGDSLLDIEVAPMFAKRHRKERRKIAAKAGKVIHQYEHAFLDHLDHSAVIDGTALAEPLRALIEHAVGRMGGFDLGETRAYYKRIVARAWRHAEALGEVPEQRDKTLRRDLEWLMIDPDWIGRYHRHTGGYRPGWLWPGSGGGGSAPSTGGGGGSAPSTGGGGDGHVPSIGDVASSFAGWSENQASRIADTIMPGSISMDGAKGVIDLSGADKVTADIFEAFASSSGGGGGGFSSGGCACAGCACACACAGGGR